MKFIAFDIELTCDRDVLNYPYQIIEVAAVYCCNGKIESTYQTYVKPTKPYEISAFCTELTGITAEHLSSAPTIVEVAGRLTDLIVKSKPDVVISWGKSDANLLEAECTSVGFPSPLQGKNYQDFKKQYCKARKIKRVGLKTALRISGVAAEGRPHSALDDAINLAKLYITEN